ncbi:MAG: DUF5694 domain-containing protein [Chitinophagales bacterium]|nr:DUF5694 domain-containing protein [Chitinophagales bacterium]
MKILKITLNILILSLFFSCNNPQEILKIDDESTIVETKDSVIRVLNFATFHMGYTNDAYSMEFDENNKKNVDSIHQIAKILSTFKPTVIVVETTPDYNETLQKSYSTYLKTPNVDFEEPDEIELFAFEIGRLSDVKRIYGIDHKLEYNYRIGSEIINSIDSTILNNFQANPFKSIPNLNPFENGLSLKEKLVRMNHPKLLDLLITANADILTYAGTENGFEGADEAAKYYQRNLRIYSNLNRLELNKNDRVFILSGGSHTAFLREFMKRDEKYEMVNTFDYLK